MAGHKPKDELHQLIESEVHLPSPPAIAVQILQTVQNRDSSMEDLERIISADPALTGKMLRIANSAFYSLPYEVKSVSHALAILGTNVIKNIALSFVIAADLRANTETYFDFDYFWKRSVTAAVAADLVSTKIGDKNEDIFVAALLQDLGVLTMYLIKGMEYIEILKQYMMSRKTGLAHFEQEKYQFDHQQLGHLLLKSWDIPPDIREPILFHHTPLKAPEQYVRSAMVLDVANLLSAIYSGNGESGGSFRVLRKKMEEYFSTSPDIMREIIDQVARDSVDVLRIFEIDPGEMKPYSQMLQEANDELGKLNLSYEQLVLELKESKERAERFAGELRRANIKLEQLAFRDGLTGLFNHRYFQESFDRELARAKRYGHPLSLIMFDIDLFKEVNDTYGHPAGDQVLKNLAQTVLRAIRPSDILARYGGEEFAVILPETNLTGLKVFAERLRRCVAALTTHTSSTEIRVTISLGGTCLMPEESFSKKELIFVADRALYNSKTNGRNRTTILSPQVESGPVPS